MTHEYLPVFLMFIMAVGFAAITLIMSAVFGARGRFHAAADEPYECGMPLLGPASVRFSVKFYRVALLFILFDIEVVFLYPWAVVYRKLLSTGMFIFVEMLVFLGVLFIGYVYAWKKGALQWDR